MKHTPTWTAIAAACLLCAGAASAAPANTLPAGVRGPVTETVYDGTSDDLLTAGLGKTGLMGAAPAFADPLHPTPAELRRNAIYVNYRALVDYTAAGGMGVFYGPNIDVDGRDTLGEGKVPGRETLAWYDDGSGLQNVTLMVQVPDRFDPARPCIVTATSSGSRGIYGAIGTAGEWGLKHGCAVAYTDKGSGNGLHELGANLVTLRDGRVVDAASAGTEALFRAPLSDAEREALLAQAPYRVAYKHAHSKQNPEADWGRHTLEAVRFAFWVLNERYGKVGRDGRREATLQPRNTIVIASSVSNGGGAALAAAEQDREGLIDGVAVSEPNAQPRWMHGLTIREGDTPVATIGRPLADYFTYANLYQPCALLAPAAGGGAAVASAFWPAAFTASAQNRCTALAAKGLVAGATLAEQADDALARLHAYGWTTDADFLHQSHYRFATNSIATTYTNAYGRFGVEDRLCGFSFANTDAAGAPIAPSASAVASIFSTGNGVPPTTGVNIVYDASSGGAKLDFLAVSPSTGVADFALDGALCQRSLVTGRDAADRLLTGAQREAAQRVRRGVTEVRLDGRLRGKPVLIVAGRSDALLPVNHAARAYYARTQAHGGADNVRYVEVTNAQHFDSFISLGAFLGYDARFIPLHVYFNRAMDAMWAHLTQGAALPPSQVVHTVPRGGSPGAAPALTSANVPAIQAAPAEGARIVFGDGTLVVPK
ncbi:hydroxybutyrate-dimer hydrolase [Rubrivivax gelatinosus]|uniref:D-(-)-3-hydroxybutyrate oligomer hydrolase n=1 Tax=Rubrivivax gelatinosus TaxID=28068 RepID=UPI0018C9E44F|nr:D-(-)-3-hydroxybutyrate oligomer hydrolase [Rubrivivax gelatinosus]MBG6079595.1 hydroxybutyrate-dimer hydrolase [Rubrivivax gelatinosus]